MGEAEKELRCESCGRVIKPERDEKVERVRDEDGVVRVFCELDMCRQESLEVHIRAFNARVAPERAATAMPSKPMVRICESCGREIGRARRADSPRVAEKWRNKDVLHAAYVRPRRAGGRRGRRAGKCVTTRKLKPHIRDIMMRRLTPQDHLLGSA